MHTDLWIEEYPIRFFGIDSIIHQPLLPVTAPGSSEALHRQDPPEGSAGAQKYPKNWMVDIDFTHLLNITISIHKYP